MSAFGSYAGQVEVDFEAVNQGIFLITGDTGAGKTTIFDAITYALYDETSGGRRNGDMMRSEFADEDTLTFVELTFLYEGKTYQIRRNPNFLRRSKRKNKDGEYTFAQEAASVELILPDGKPFRGKVKETNQKIIEIIGLDVNQFTQIAMIAQGEFMKLLVAPSKERKEIFSKIFDTRIYWRIQKELSDRAKGLYGKLCDNQKQITFELDGVALIEDSAYQQEWKEYGRFSETNPERSVELIQLIIEETKKKEEELKEAAKQQEKELSLVKDQIAKGNEINQLFTQLEAIQKELEMSQQKALLIQQKKEDIKKARNALQVVPKEQVYQKAEFLKKEKEQQLASLREEMSQLVKKTSELLKIKEEKEKEVEERSPALTTEITRLTDSLSIYDKLDHKVEEGKQARIKEEEVKRLLEQEIKALTSYKKQIDEIQQEQENYKESAANVVRLEQQLKELGQIYKDLDALIALAAEIVTLQAEEEACKKATTDALTFYQQKSAIYEQFNEAFIKEQVGIIADSLKPGEECPVCGSTSHPKPATLSKEAVTQQEVARAKKERDTADELKSKESEKLSQASSKLHAKKETYQNEGMRILGPEFIYGSEWLAIAGEKRKESVDKGKVVRQELDLEKQKKERLDQNVVLLGTLTKNVSESTLRQEALTTSYHEAQLLSQTLKKEELLLREGLLYESLSKANVVLNQIQQQKATLENEKKVATDQYQLVLERYQQITGQVSNATKELENQTIELAKLQTEYLQAITEWGFETETEYRNAKVEERTVKQWELECNEFELQLSKLKATYQVYLEQTKGKEKVELKSWLEKQEQLEHLGQQMQARGKEYYSILKKDESVYQHVKEAFKDRVKLREEFERLSRLDKAANGKLVGQAGLDFQTYIQRRYFKNIIHEANKRLVVMSSNRFILQCKDFEDLSKRGEVGLDLDVYSLVTDKTRDVKTLSGGESFMAALSMALGMADVMQNTAGKIHLDTMFIDEGFGSLDEDSRNQAIRILNDLAGDRRLVGIISHVTELKEQIERKLIVKKDSKGSTISWNF